MKTIWDLFEDMRCMFCSLDFGTLEIRFSNGKISFTFIHDLNSVMSFQEQYTWSGTEWLYCSSNTFLED